MKLKGALFLTLPRHKSVQLWKYECDIHDVYALRRIAYPGVNVADDAAPLVSQLLRKNEETINKIAG